MPGDLTFPSAKTCFDRRLSSERKDSVPGYLLEISFLMFDERSEYVDPAACYLPTFGMMIEPLISTVNEVSRVKPPNNEILNLSPILMMY